MRLETLQARLKAVPNLSGLARTAGLTRKSLQRIRDGEQSPTLRTLEKLVAALKTRAARPKKAAP